MDYAEHTHDHEHDHSHEHDHPHDHDHPHEHDHPHDHNHPHSHLAPGQSNRETVAVLQYMLDHNIHHAAELNEFAGQLSGEAQHQMRHAVEAFDQANGYLSSALELIRKEAAK